MSGLQNRSSQLFKYTRLFNNVSLPRLSSTTAKSSAEVIQREKKVSANNYDPSPVVITRGEGYYLIVLLNKKFRTGLKFKNNLFRVYFYYYYFFKCI